METVSLFGPEDAQRRQAVDLVLAEWTNVVGSWGRGKLLGRIKGALGRVVVGETSGQPPGRVVSDYVRSLHRAVERTAQLRDALTDAKERRSAAFDAVLSQLNRHVEETNFLMQQLYFQLPPEVREDSGTPTQKLDVPEAQGKWKWSASPIGPNGEELGTVTMYYLTQADCEADRSRAVEDSRYRSDRYRKDLLGIQYEESWYRSMRAVADTATPCTPTGQ